MERYIDIRLLPDPEFPANLLMNALFAKLHRGLVGWGNNRIGVSFPRHDDGIPTLGKCLRLHGDQQDLDDLMARNWFCGMRDNILVVGPETIPTSKVYRCVYRVQAKSSPERLRRRYMQRHHTDAQTARQTIPDSTAEMLTLPYVNIGSQSTGQRFRLFIAHGAIVEKPVEGSFNHYGLSPMATIPWF